MCGDTVDVNQITSIETFIQAAVTYGFAAVVLALIEAGRLSVHGISG